MPFDGITLGFTVKELSQRLCGGKIDKVQQPEKDEIIITVRKDGESLLLLLSSDPGCARAHITNEKKPSPLEPPNLCMLMRKHLTGGRITQISQLKCDRIMAIDIAHTDELGDRAFKRIICEFMGKHSNIILVNADGKILECARHITDVMSSFREVLPGLAYRDPPAHGKLNFEAVTAEALLSFPAWRPGSGAKAIKNSISGISQSLAQELCLRTGGSEEYEITEESASVFASAVAECLNRFINEPAEPRVYLDAEGNAADVSAFELLSLDGTDSREYKTISDAFDAYYTIKADADRIQQKISSIAHVLKQNHERLCKKAAIQLDALTSSERSEEYRVKGEMLAASAYMIKKGMKQVTVPNYYSEDCSNITIELDEKLNAAANSQRYFKLYKKAQNARKLAGEQYQKAKEEIDYIENQMENLSKCADDASLAELKEELVKFGYIKRTLQRTRIKQLPPSKPICVKLDDAEIFIGRNNLQNERLTFGAQNDDMWLHVKDAPGSHVIIKTASLTDETLLTAARLAAGCSSLKASSNVAVDYTLKRYVKKPSGSRPGFVNYTHQHTLYVEPLIPPKETQE